MKGINMKPLASISLLGLLLFTLSSCRKSNPVNSSSGQQMWPLQVGNTWVMRWDRLDTSGNVLSSGYDTTLVTGDTLISGNTWYHVSWGGISTDLMINKSDGVYNMSNGTAQPTWKYPAKVGDQYVLLAGSHYMNIQSTDTSLTVPEGIYSCYEYRDFQVADNLPTEVDFLSPGVGPVQTEVYGFVGTSSNRLFCSERLRLVSFTLK